MSTPTGTPPTADDYHRGMKEIYSELEPLGSGFVAAFLTGSIARGQIKPGTSDIDMATCVADELVHSWDTFQTAYQRFFAMTDAYARVRKRLWLERSGITSAMQPPCHIWLAYDLQHVTPFQLHFVRSYGKTLVGKHLWDDARNAKSDRLAFSLMPLTNFYGHRQDFMRVAVAPEQMDDWDRERCSRFMKLILENVCFARTCIGLFDIDRPTRSEQVTHDFGPLRTATLIDDLHAMRDRPYAGADCRAIIVRATELFDDLSAKLTELYHLGRIVGFGGALQVDAIP